MRAFATIAVAAFLVLSASCTKESKKTEKSEVGAEAQAAKVMAPGESEEMAAAPAEQGGECGEAGEGGSCCGGSGGGSCCGGGHGQGQPAVQTAAVPDGAVWTTLKVAGMKCGNCAKRIQSSLAGVEGVLGVTADHGAGEVKIATAPGTEDVRAKIAPRINELGYKVLDI